MYHISPNAHCTLDCYMIGYFMNHTFYSSAMLTSSLLSGITCSQSMVELTEHQRSEGAHRASWQMICSQNLSNGLRVNGDAANYGRIGRIKGNRWRSYISYPPNVRHPQSTASAPRYQILQHFKLTNGFTGGATEPPKAKES